MVPDKNGKPVTLHSECFRMAQRAGQKRTETKLSNQLISLLDENVTLVENPRVKPKDIKPEGINFGAVVWVCCLAGYVYLNVKYRDTLPFFRGGGLNSPTPFVVIATLAALGTVYVWWANRRDSARGAVMNMEEVRDTILKSSAGMRNILADLKHPDAESFYRRLHDVELMTEAAKTEDQLASAKQSFAFVWNALRSTPAGDGDVVLNGARCEKYLIQPLLL
jgi:hypothetical protein